MFSGRLFFFFFSRDISTEREFCGADECLWGITGSWNQAMSQTGVTGKGPHHYGLYLPHFPPVYCHGWWDTESSHSLRDVLFSKLTPVGELQNFRPLQLPSIWNGNPQGACSPFRNPKEAGSALQLTIWPLLSPWLLPEPPGLPGSLPERVSSRRRWVKRESAASGNAFSEMHTVSEYM